MGSCTVLIRDISKLPKRKDGEQWEWGGLYEGKLFGLPENTIVKLYGCHKAQLDILGSKARYTAAFAGAQGGKTAVGALWLYKKAVKVGGGRGLVVSPTVPMRKNSQIEDHINRIFAGTDFEGKINEKNGEYRSKALRSDHTPLMTIRFLSADNPVSLDGGVYDFVLLDEAAKLSHDAKQRAKTRSDAKAAPLLAVSTPDVQSSVYDEFAGNTIEKREGIRESKDGKYYMRQWSSIDRPGFDKESYENAKLTRTAAEFDRMYRGIFTRFEGLVFECFSDLSDPLYPVIKTPDPLRFPFKCLQTIGGGDFGFTTDPAAFLLAGECEDGVIYVVDEIYERGLNNDQLAERIIKMKSQWETSSHFKFADALGSGRATTFYCDTEDPKAIDTLKRYGIQARGRKVKDILPGIFTLNAMFKAGRLKIFDRCTNLITELKKYQWQRGRSGDFKDEPSEKDNHLVDSARYCISSYMLNKKITPIFLDQYSEDEQEERDMQAAVRLAVVPVDPVERDASLKEQAENALKERHRQWFIDRMNQETGV